MVFVNFCKFLHVSKHKLARLALPQIAHLPYFNLIPKPCPLYPNTYIRFAQVGRLKCQRVSELSC
jgi:hypothetical protein